MNEESPFTTNARSSQGPDYDFGWFHHIHPKPDWSEMLTFSGGEKFVELEHPLGDTISSICIKAPNLYYWHSDFDDDSITVEFKDPVESGEVKKMAILAFCQSHDEIVRNYREDTMTDDDITIEVGEQYHLREHGDVQVLSLYRKIDAANRNGVAEETISVNFSTDPPSNRADVPDWKRGGLEIGEFIDSITTERQQ